MKRKTRVLPGARAEYADATEWYEDRRPGLGKEFAAAVHAAFREIEERPLAWPHWQRLPEYRYFVMNRFPYTVFYRVTDDELEITAVAHGKRRPGYWVQRNTEDEEATPTGQHIKVLWPDSTAAVFADRNERLQT